MQMPKFIHENCPECFPGKNFAYRVMELADHLDESDDVDTLYLCTSCNARVYVPEQWAREHEVEGYE